MYKFFIFIIIPAVLVLVMFRLLTQPEQPAAIAPEEPDKEEQPATNFEECAASGRPVMESYPRRCNAGGKTYVEDIGNELDKLDLIRVSRPRPNESVGSPLFVAGEARGSWFFEASFPVRLVDEQSREIAVVPAQAKGEWMTGEFVPFEAKLEFGAPETERGFLILEKANASGLPEHADELRIPVIFR